MQHGKATRKVNQAERSEHMLRPNLVISPIVSNVLEGPVSLHGLSHIVRVFAAGGRVVDVVTVVVFDDAINAIPHVFVESNGLLVALADEQINEPGISGLGTSFELLGKNPANPQAAGLGCYSEGSDVGMPRKVVFRALEVIRRTLRFAHD